LALPHVQIKRGKAYYFDRFGEPCREPASELLSALRSGDKEQADEADERFWEAFRAHCDTYEGEKSQELIDDDNATLGDMDTVYAPRRGALGLRYL
jgi:hypothetical protein